ncbi:capsule biosynthesis GfcC D2 domain-containing protein [[Erwinia] mediterraneensis]|uniref:capsule biosynthesis GfcC D2 domain-containing protein n=1 Tax=[Erwinia] mediterraneensis TaxID=2161819 RepID=UPI00102FE67C|nr:capsule biosynthesis GfcC D2 domain-containing protein [[Erwinia] mediterraneensis]
MKNIMSLLAGLAFCGSAVALADSQVTVHYPGNSATVQVDHAQDLATLLASPALAGRSWWPGTLIAEHGATAIAQQHYQQTLAALRAWQAQTDGERAAAIGQVIQQLSRLRVTGRQFTPLDPDWVRIRPEANRRLKGRYDVYTLDQPDSVLLVGAIADAGAVSWQPGRDVRDYLEGHARLAGAEKSVVTVITPAGATLQVPVAYFNHRYAEVEPGSTLFVGFSDGSLPHAFADLNSRILTVLTHRIPD